MLSRICILLVMHPPLVWVLFQQIILKKHSSLPKSRFRGVYKEVDFPYVLGRSMDHFENTHKIEIKQSFWNRGSIFLKRTLISKMWSNNYMID